MRTEWRLVQKWGKTYAECRYTTEEWTNWLFPISLEKKANYIYQPELNVWRRNYSI